MTEGGDRLSREGTFFPADRRSPRTVFPRKNGPGGPFFPRIGGPGGPPDGGTVIPATPVNRLRSRSAVVNRAVTYTFQ